MRIVIVGAGMSGLSAARHLHLHGHAVTLLDKGRSPGGRLATRRIGEATVDHGAQFFTVRTPEYQNEVTPWIDEGLVTEWCRGFETDDGHPRYVVAGGMNRLAKRLADGLDVRTDCLVFAIRPAEAGWEVALDDGTSLAADALVVTSPLPQTFALLATSGVELPGELLGIGYDKILGLLAVLDRPAGIAPPGGIQGADETFGFVADNVAKGVSAEPALTLHSTPAVADAWWDRDPADAHAHLLAAARSWFGPAEVVTSQLKRWRFARPTRLWPEPCWVAPADHPVVCAGDAFAGPWVRDPSVAGSNLEGAWWSGRAAALAILRS